MLILAATPIGNLSDASTRLIRALETTPVIAAEDTRTARRLLAGLGVTASPQLLALHEHNENERAAWVVQQARDSDVLILSDAGMPTISDPGFVLVAAAVTAGVPVTVIPGPSAVTTALAVSGLPSDRFVFEGFMPRKAGQRQAALAALAADPRTLVFFESPARVAQTLADMVAAFGAGRAGAVCRELTKLHEEVARGTLAELADWASAGVRGELVIVVHGAPAREVAFDAAVGAVRDLVRTGIRLGDAAKEVAANTGHPKRDLYRAVIGAE